MENNGKQQNEHEQNLANGQTPPSIGSEVTALQTILESVSKLPPDARIRVLDYVAKAYQLDLSANPRMAEMTSYAPNYSEKTSQVSPKTFIADKKPITDVERVACLAYYLAHYRQTPYFKTLDISKLNTEAAQPKFSNAAFTIVNATNSGYLVQATKGQKQLSAMGERYVLALPDRDAAKEELAQLNRRKRKKPNSK